MMNDSPSSWPVLPQREAGFTLIELLVTMAIIAVILGILLPALFVVRERQARARASGMVSQLHMALTMYADEDQRHRFPPQGPVGDRTLRWNPNGAAPGNLNLLTSIRINLDISSLDRSGSPPYPLLDPWSRPYQYQVDDDLLGATGPQRPLNLKAWNEAGHRPWAYVWSQGKEGASDGSTWIYPKDNQ